MSDTFWDPPLPRLDDWRDAAGEPPHVDPDAADTDLKGFTLGPEAAGRLRAWFAERGLVAEALDAVLAEPRSTQAFRDNLTRTIRRGRALRHGA
jgi:hypothetical protein